MADPTAAAGGAAAPEAPGNTTDDTAAPVHVNLPSSITLQQPHRAAAMPFPPAGLGMVCDDTAAPAADTGSLPKLMISNLPPSWGPHDVRNAVKQFGLVHDCRMLGDRRASIQLSTAPEVLEAFQTLPNRPPVVADDGAFKLQVELDGSAGGAGTVSRKRWMDAGGPGVLPGAKRTRLSDAGAPPSGYPNTLNLPMSSATPLLPSPRNRTRDIDQHLVQNIVNKRRQAQAQAAPKPDAAAAAAALLGGRLSMSAAGVPPVLPMDLGLPRAAAAPTGTTTAAPAAAGLDLTSLAALAAAAVGAGGDAAATTAAAAAPSSKAVAPLPLPAGLVGAGAAGMGVGAPDGTGSSASGDSSLLRDAVLSILQKKKAARAAGWPGAAPALGGGRGDDAAAGVVGAGAGGDSLLQQALKTLQASGAAADTAAPAPPLAFSTTAGGPPVPAGGGAVQALLQVLQAQAGGVPLAGDAAVPNPVGRAPAAANSTSGSALGHASANVSASHAAALVNKLRSMQDAHATKKRVGDDATAAAAPSQQQLAQLASLIKQAKQAHTVAPASSPVKARTTPPRVSSSTTPTTTTPAATTAIGGAATTPVMTSAKRVLPPRPEGPQAVYMVMKSSCHEFLAQSVEHELWYTSKAMADTLNKLLRSNKTVILLFSVRGSGYFTGYAEMYGPVRHRTEHLTMKDAIDQLPPSWQYIFRLNWLRVGSVDFADTIHLKSDGRAVQYARDGETVEQEAGAGLATMIDASAEKKARKK